VQINGVSEARANIDKRPTLPVSDARAAPGGK
jgi:hypothetical protein